MGAMPPRPGEIFSCSSLDLSTELHEDSTVFHRMYKLVNMSLPLVFSYMLRLGETFIAIYFASYLSREEGDTAIFAGISLAQMFVTISSVSLFIGMSTALETLGSQHNGAKNYSEVGIALQRSYIVLSIMLIPILVLWYFAGPIFLAIHVDSHICEILEEYISVIVLMLPIRIFAVCYRKYLICIGITWPALYYAIIQDAVFLGVGFLFVHRLKWGVQGVAWASVLGTHCSAIFQLAASWKHPDVQKTIGSPSREALDVSKLWEFVQLGTPGMIMICSEWWAFEILTLFASQISAAAVTAQTLLFNIGNVGYMTPSCIGQGTSSLVGNAIGAKQNTLASELGDLYILFTFSLEILVIMPSMFLGGDAFGRFFTDDPAVIDIYNRCIPVLAVMALADGVQAVAAGVLRGSGKQALGAYANVACYYLIALPLAYWLCFWQHLDVIGLFVGIGVGSATQCVIVLYFVLFNKSYIYWEAISDTGGHRFELVERDESSDTVASVKGLCDTEAL